VSGEGSFVMKTSAGCLGIEPREVVIALAYGHCDCRDIRSAQVFMKGGSQTLIYVAVFLWRVGCCWTGKMFP